MNDWELGDLYKIVLNWVAERQRAHELSDKWGSAQAFNGDKLITYYRDGMRIGPYVIIYDNRQPPARYEAHKHINPRAGLVEVVGMCNAADPQFFERLLSDMVFIQTCAALDEIGNDHEC